MWFIKHLFDSLCILCCRINFFLSERITLNRCELDCFLLLLVGLFVVISTSLQLPIAEIPFLFALCTKQPCLGRDPECGSVCAGSGRPSSDTSVQQATQTLLELAPLSPSLHSVTLLHSKRSLGGFLLFPQVAFENV